VAHGSSNLARPILPTFTTMQKLIPNITEGKVTEVWDRVLCDGYSSTFKDDFAIDLTLSS
jgi:hypothetical protein